jgi:hypothetical protein
VAYDTQQRDFRASVESKRESRTVPSLLAGLSDRTPTTPHSRHSSAKLRTPPMAVYGLAMSEGIVIEIGNEEIAGIVVRQAAERSFLFHASTKQFDALDSHVFVSAQAAHRAIGDFVKLQPIQHFPRVASAGVFP